MEEKEEKEENEFGKEFIVKMIRLVVGLVLALLGQFYFSETNFSLPVNLAIMLLSWIILSYDVLIDAVKDIIKEHEFFSEDLLMIIASIGAFAIRAFGPEANEFIEGVMVMLLFQIGETFEDIADYRSHKAIQNAVGLRAPIAHKKEDETCIDINPEELKIGDIVSVRVGEILPADGTIIQGSGYLDMSSLTGEPVPVKKEENQFVNAGTILKEGSILVKVEKEFKDNTVSKILNLIEEGSNSKSKATRFVDKFAKIYTPIVVILAVVLAILPPLIIQYNNPTVWEQWIYRSLNLLIISCPCAIVISVPLTYFSGIGLASKNGIIIKGAGIFDRLSDLGTLVTDKTGTLTYGDFHVTEIHARLSEEEFMSYIKTCESKSNHPIAYAITKSETGRILKEPENYEEIAGMGVKCRIEGKEVLCGNPKLLEKENIQYEPAKEVGTIVYLALDHVYQGYLVLSDSLREESKDLVDSLHKKNIKVVMLTGDKEESAKKTSEALSLDEYHSQLLPQDKTDILKKKIQEKTKSIAYMGDGINDAASIALSDIGIAMGGAGSDLAIDNADVVIMNDNPKKVLLSLRIAALVKKHVIFNIAVSLLVKLTIMILAMTLKTFPMIVSVIADTGLTMILIVISVLMLHHRFRKQN